MPPQSHLRGFAALLWALCVLLINALLDLTGCLSARPRFEGDLLRVRPVLLHLLLMLAVPTPRRGGDPT